MMLCAQCHPCDEPCTLQAPSRGPCEDCGEVADCTDCHEHAECWMYEEEEV